MNLHSKLRSIFFVPERQWSGTMFFLFFCAYFILNLYLALPNGTATILANHDINHPTCAVTPTDKISPRICSQTLSLTTQATANDYMLFFGQGDPASYAAGGLLLAGKEWGGSYPTMKLPMMKRLKLMNLIGFGMWPPGMFLFNALPLIMNADIPLGLYQVVVASVLWAVSFALFASLLILRARLWLAVISPIFLMSFPLFHDYFMRYGAMYSETYGAAFMTIGFSLLALFYYRKTNNGLMIIAGLCFAVASFFRSQMFPVSVGVSVILITYLLWVLKINQNSSNRKQGFKSATLLFLLAFYLPIGGYMAFNRGALFHADYVWEAPFSIPAYPNAGAGNFLVLGGMRAACLVDMKKCEELQNQIKPGAILPHAHSEVLNAFILHPIKFSLYKLPIAWRFWMGNSGPSDSITLYRYDNILILAILLFCLAFMMIRKLWLFLSFTLITIALILGPPFLLHFEVRYFYLIDAFLLFLPFWLLFVCSPEINTNEKKTALHHE